MTGGGRGAEVAIYVHDLRASGVVRNAYRIAAALARAGRPVELIAGSAEGALEQEAPAGVPLVRLAERAGGSRLRRAVRLRRRLRLRPPLLLLSAGNFGHQTVWAASRGLPRPLRIYRISNPVERPAAIEGRGPRARARQAARRWLMRRLARDARMITLVGGATDSPAFAAARRRGRLRTIRNGVDLGLANRGRAAPSPHAWLDGPDPVLIAVGRLHRQKNFDVLVEALARLPEPRPRLVILGTGTPAAAEGLRSLAERRGVGDRLLLPGAVPDPAAWLVRARVFALPSLWEGSSNALLEALVCGLPVVASRTAGDAAQILADGRFGLLVDPSNITDLAAAINRQLSPAAVLPGSRAQDFAADASETAYLALLEELLSELLPSDA